MKYLVIKASLLVGGVIFCTLLNTVPIYAAATVKSDGKASFVPQTGDINIIKPGTNESIDMVDGSGNRVIVDNIQLMHVPDFEFGNNETDINTKDYSALYERYQKVGQTEKFAIPHFVQVGDTSGVEGTKWAVSVEQDTLLTESGGHELKNSRIQLYDQTLTNNVRNTDVSNMVTGLTIPADSMISIPVATKDSTGPVSILTSKAGTGSDSTNATITSNVLSKNYDETIYGKPGSPTLMDRNNSVKLNVLQSDSVQAKAYTTKLNWTLTVGP